MAADPFDEAAHRWYMSASAAAGEPAKALAAYEALRQRLGDNLGTDPAPQTRDLHLAILREQDHGLTAGARAGGAERSQPTTRRPWRDATTRSGRCGRRGAGPSRVGPG